MLKKYKQLVIGFILGALLFSLPVLAENKNIDAFFNNIKVTIDGKDIAMDTEPMIYAGRTYVPVRFIAENLGMQVNFNETTNTVEIKKAVQPVTILPSATNPPDPTPEPTVIPMPIPTPTLTPEPTSASSPTFYTQDGYDFARRDGKEYISCKSSIKYVQDIQLKNNKTIFYNLGSFSISNNRFCLIKSSLNSTESPAIILDNIPFTNILGNTNTSDNNYIDYSYFKDTIIPLIK